MVEQHSPITHSPEDTQLSTNVADPPVLHYRIHKFPESLCEPGRLCFPAPMQSCPWMGSNMNGLGAEAVSVWISSCRLNTANNHIYSMWTNAAHHLGMAFYYLDRVKQKSRSKLHMEPSCSHYQGMCLPCQQLISSLLILSERPERVIR